MSSADARFAEQVRICREAGTDRIVIFQEPGIEAADLEVLKRF